jgi:hypothetical protein
MVIFGPFFFGSLYRNGPKVGITRAPFLASGLVIGLAEFIHQRSKGTMIERVAQLKKLKADAAAAKTA